MTLRHQRNDARKEVSMRPLTRMSVTLAGALVLCGGATASAAGLPVMEVKVPFPFVVNGQTLPAGRYMVEEEDGSILLLRGEKDNRASTLASTIAIDGRDPAGAVPMLEFTHNENQYRLSSIWEPGREGWSVVHR
jgi:hypothetical protein